MQHSDNSDFMKTVEEIKLSEEQAEKLKLEAKEKAEQIVKKGKETTMKIKAETDEQIVKNKNKILQAGKESIEKEVDEVVQKAHQTGESLKKKKLKKEDSVAILKEFIFKL